MSRFVEIMERRIPVGEHSSSSKLLKLVKKSVGLRFGTRDHGTHLVLQHEGEDVIAPDGHPVIITRGKLNPFEAGLILKAIKSWHESK